MLTVLTQKASYSREQLGADRLRTTFLAVAPRAVEPPGTKAAAQGLAGGGSGEAAARG